MSKVFAMTLNCTVLNAAGLPEPTERSHQASVRYVAVQLHDRSRWCWAIVSEPDGAITEDETGALLMRLTESEAQRMAAAMNGVTNTTLAGAADAAPRTLLVEAGDDAAPARRAVA